MADGVNVDTSELSRFERVLARAGVEIQKVNEEELTAAAKQFKEDAKRDAPVDTGALQRSIRIWAGKEWRRVGSPLKQGFFTEFGTSRMSPQPWLYHNGDRAGVRVEDQLTKNGTRLILRRHG